jgi:hypothetical protein
MGFLNVAQQKRRFASLAKSSTCALDFGDPSMDRT